MLFWIIAFLLSVMVAGVLITPLLRVQNKGGSEPENIAIYRDQLAEVDRDLARGVLEEAEAERVRVEVSRRLLAADAEARAQGRDAPKSANIAIAAVTGAVVLAGGLGLYHQLGAPGYPDIPLAARIAASEEIRETRMSQAQAEAQATPIQIPDFPDDYIASIAQLREVVPTRPDDIRGWQLLSQHENNLRNYAAAARAQSRVIALKGTEVTAQDREVLLSQLVSAARGFVSPEAEQLAREILVEDIGNAAARYYFGLLYLQTDRPDRAFQIFRAITEEERIGPFSDLARESVEEAAFRAGVDYTLPPRSGPALEDVMAMNDVDDATRAEMIGAMVTRLSTRLAEEGGTLIEWQRLITGLSVLGEVEQAREIYAEAIDLFGSSEAAQTSLDQTARRAGLIE